MRVTFVGSDPRVGRQIEGVTYFPGQTGEVSDMWGAILIHSGQAVAYMPPLSGDDRIAEPEVSHRDTFGKKARAR